MSRNGNYSLCCKECGADIGLTQYQNFMGLCTPCFEDAELSPSQIAGEDTRTGLDFEPCPLCGVPGIHICDGADRHGLYGLPYQ